MNNCGGQPLADKKAAKGGKIAKIFKIAVEASHRRLQQHKRNKL
jgi:hypothetical protein